MQIELITKSVEKLNGCSADPYRFTLSGHRRGIVVRGLFGLLVVYLVSFCSPQASAQAGESISGTVKDPAGLVFTGATVTADDLDTGLMRQASTNAVGRYTFQSLPIGTYEVSVAKMGFEKDVRTGVHLAVGQEAVVDFALRVGEITEQVVVNADAPAVGLTTQDVSGLVGEQQIKNFRSMDAASICSSVLNPGVVNFTWEKTGGTGVSNSTNGNNFAVSGNRPQQNHVSSQRSRVYRRSRKQHAARQHQRGTARCRGGSGIQHSA